MDPPAEWRQNDDSPVAKLVAEPLHDDAPVGREVACDLSLLGEIAQDVLGRKLVQVVMFEQPPPRPFAPALAAGQIAFELADELTQSPPQFDRPAQPVAVPERDLAGHARRRGHHHPIRLDLLHSPARSPERDHLADPALVDHLLVELADPPPRSPHLADHEDRVEPAIRDRAAARDRHSPRVAPTLDATRLAVPHDSRLQLGELVARIRPGQHPEHRLECVSGEAFIRRRAADRLEQLVGRPRLANRHCDDLLGQHVEWVARQLRLLDGALVHAPRHDRGFEEIAAVLGEDDALARLADAVPRPTHSLQAAGHAGRALDLDHEIDRAHVDAELERAGGDDRRQASGL